MEGIENTISNLNWFDITILFVIFISSLIALLRGFIKTFFSFVTWAGSATITAFSYKPAREFLSGHLDNEKLAIALSSIGIFLVVLIILAIINGYFVSSLKNQTGGFIDRFLGLTVGVARGVILTSLAFFSISLTSQMLGIGDTEKPGPKWFSEASTYEPLKESTNSILAFLPENISESLAKRVEDIKDTAEASIKENNEKKTLNPEERELMKKVISILPEEEISKLYSKHFSNGETPNDENSMLVFKDILDLYIESEKNDKIAPEKMLSDTEIEKLKKALSSAEIKPKEGVGYNQKSLEQLDRLIDSTN